MDNTIFRHDVSCGDIGSVTRIPVPGNLGSTVRDTVKVPPCKVAGLAPSVRSEENTLAAITWYLSTAINVAFGIWSMDDTPRAVNKLVKAWLVEYEYSQPLCI